MAPRPQSSSPGSLDLSGWRNVPNYMILVGGALAVLGLLLGGLKQFAHSYLTAFMFCLSLCLGALFLVLVHHLFDAGWSVPIRRTCENLCVLLFPHMAVFFLPVAALAVPSLYGWMRADPHADHALHAKFPLFTIPGFFLASALCFAVWAILTRGLRSWSLRQDETGAAECTFKMRRYSFWGIFAFAATLTLAAIMWMKALEHQWFSTMYGVYYFAGSVWVTLATVYLITMVLTRQGVLREVLHEHQFYFLGSLMFAFTVFYAYIHFSQYFIIWNGNIPEETFWYVQRERGTWFWVGMVLIFGHFFLPFLAMLRIDVKETFAIMTPLCVWAWLMHYFDMAFNVAPLIHPDGFPVRWMWLDLACIAFIAGWLVKAWLKNYASAAPFPIKDPRLIEAMGLHHPVPTQISGGELDETEDYPNGAPQTTGGKR